MIWILPSSDPDPPNDFDGLKIIQGLLWGIALSIPLWGLILSIWW